MEIQSASLPAVESSTLPFDASGMPAEIVSTKVFACSRSLFSCVHRRTLCPFGSPVKSSCGHLSSPQKQT
eukprot:1692597-Prymnesium_polylepis.2